MFQKFNTDTLGSRYIKSLLAQTPIPVFDCVFDKDRIFEGCYYVYKNYIIKCAKTGRLIVDRYTALYPSDTLYPSDELYPGLQETNYIPPDAAKFYVVRTVDVPDPKIFSAYTSSKTFYDSETHHHLCRYLRYLYSTTDINLLPFYNNYSNLTLRDVELGISIKDNSVHVVRRTTQRFKVVAIPIMFGQKYTIHLDCPTSLLLRACIYDNSGFVDESGSNTFIHEELKVALQSSGRQLSSSRFDKPFSFSIDAPDAKSVRVQKDLYLLIQLPMYNDSSIFVRSDVLNKTMSEDGVLMKPIVLNPSLSKLNTRCSYAFSDRLIEYLLGNIITKNEQISENVEKIQVALSNINNSYKQKFDEGVYKVGIWDSQLTSEVLELMSPECAGNRVYDQDGYINKDVETVLQNKGVTY